jgi:N6-adenosine-specific RNA methylase IME4
MPTPVRPVTDISIDSVVVRPGRRPVANLDVLCESIGHIGLLNPISISTENVLMAGRNRLEACRKLGWETIPAIVFSLDDIDAQLAEIDENLIRNELSILERSEQLLRRKKLYEGRPGVAKHGGDRKSAEAKSNGNDFRSIRSFSADTAAKTNVTERTVRQEVQIAEDIADDVRDKIRDTPLADNKVELVRLSRLPEHEQRKTAEKITSGEARTVKEARRVEVANQISKEPAPPPVGPFRVIVIDPPWKYENRSGDATHRGVCPYPDMTLDEINALPVPALAHDDCILWLWTTNAFLRDALSCLDAWGFKGKTVLTWVKHRMGLGDWLRGQTEHCIFAVRGKPVVTLTNQTTALFGPVREHSRKPDEFYELVDSLCPGSKIEMFARQERAGWTSWGAEKRLFEVA